MILAVSLYAPHIAKLLAYADCSVQVILSNQPGYCDCSRIVDHDDIPLTNLPGKQKDISIKTDWKYTVSGKISVNPFPGGSNNKCFSYYQFSIPGRRPANIFQPPRA